MKSIFMITLSAIALIIMPAVNAGEVSGLPANYPSVIENFGHVEMVDLQSKQVIINDTKFNVSSEFVVNLPNNTTSPLAGLKLTQLVAYDFTGNEMYTTPTLTQVWVMPARISMQVLQKAQQED